MKPISFTIGMNAYDCYLYGGYVFFIMRDGRILYGSYPQIISRLEHKYDMFSGLIKIAFLRNDYYHSNVAKTFLRIPALKECIYKEWDRLSLQEGLFLDFEEIEDISTINSEKVDFSEELSKDEYITSIKLDFGKVDVGFKTEKETIIKAKVNSNVKRKSY